MAGVLGEEGCKQVGDVSADRENRPTHHSWGLKAGTFKKMNLDKDGRWGEMVGGRAAAEPKLDLLMGMLDESSGTTDQAA